MAKRRGRTGTTGSGRAAAAASPARGGRGAAWWLLGATAAVLLVGAGVRAGLDPGHAIGGPFRLQGTDGRWHDERGFPGRFQLIFFGDADCADWCPLTLKQMSDALKRLDPGAARVQPILITVDPAHDTPAHLRQYVAPFGPHLLGLTGTPGALAPVWRAFGVRVEERDAAIDHTAALFLLDPRGRVAAIIPAAADSDAIGAVLRRHVPALPGA
ncbi:MAG: SCO family protein [Gluconacetobacter diazotrophicus]|nr:SCO family protein [Gluconacetobacter diazotrophicus]